LSGRVGKKLPFFADLFPFVEEGGNSKFDNSGWLLCLFSFTVG